MKPGEWREYRRRLAVRQARRLEVEYAAGWHDPRPERSLIPIRLDDDEEMLRTSFREFKISDRPGLRR